MAYMRYHETEKLFTVWPELEAILESLSFDLMAVRAKDSMGTDEDYIYSLCIGNKVIDNMPHTGRISDSTYNVTTNYGKLARCDRRMVKTELTSEALEISIVIDKLQLAFRRLSPLQREILALYYWDKKTWKEIAEAIKTDRQFYSIRQFQEKRYKGIEKMTRIMKVSIETYVHIVKIMV